jgi:hypothetical protein
MIKLRSLGLGLALMLGSAVGVGAAPFPNCPANSPGVVWLYQAPSGRIITQSAGPGSVPIAPSNPNAVPYLYQAGPERGLQQYRCRMAAPEHSVQGRCGKGYHREVGLLMNGRRGPTGCVADLTRSPHCAPPLHLYKVKRLRRVMGPSGVYESLPAETFVCRESRPADAIDP